MTIKPTPLDLTAMRREYLQGGLQRTDLAVEPMAQLQSWFSQASEAQLQDASAMVLATVGASGSPSQRVVLMKQLDEQGIVFYTNYASRKAQDMAQEPKVSVHFSWLELERQVLVEGVVSKISTLENQHYFAQRPRESQLAAWASRQSSSVESRAPLDEQLEEMRVKFDGAEVPLPPFWGGYRINPHRVEFWQGREARLHDRFEYSQHGSLWKVSRLQP